MGPPSITPSFLSASSLTKYQRKKRANGGNGCGSGVIPGDDPSSHTLYNTNNSSTYGQMNVHDNVFFNPSGLTPNINNLNLLTLGSGSGTGSGSGLGLGSGMGSGLGTGVDSSPHNILGYFGSPRLEDGRDGHSGLTPGHQFFMFGSGSRSGRTPTSASSAPFSAGVSEVDTSEKNRHNRGIISELKGSGYSSARRHDRNNYYRTGLTPATNDNDSPMKLSTENTPLSDIGDLSISSSVFSPSFSPSKAFGLTFSGRNSSRNEVDEVENEVDEVVMRRKESNAQLNSKSPKTERALSLLADCIVVAQKAPQNRAPDSKSLTHSHPQ